MIAKLNIVGDQSWKAITLRMEDTASTQPRLQPLFTTSSRNPGHLSRNTYARFQVVTLALTRVWLLSGNLPAIVDLKLLIGASE